MQPKRQTETNEPEPNQNRHELRMQHILKDIHELDHVLGCLFVTADGSPVHVHFSSALNIPSDGYDWGSFVNAIQTLREAEVLFDDMRLYIRKTNIGYLMVVMEIYAVQSFIKLQCDVLISKIEKLKTKGLKRFFRK